MKKIIIFIIFIALGVVSAVTIKDFDNDSSPAAVTSASNAQNSSDFNTSTLDKVNNVNSAPAPDFKLKDLNGNEVSLSSFKGKKVFLNFWTTWCPYCVQELPDIEKLYQNVNSSDIVVLAVDSQETPDKVKNYIASHNYHFTVLLDTEGVATKEYSVSGIPVTFFIDKDGNMYKKNVGALTLEQMETIK